MDKIHSFMKKQFVQKSGVRSGNLTIGQKSYKTRKILQSGIPEVAIFEKMQKMDHTDWYIFTIMFMLLNDSLTKENLVNFVTEFSFIEWGFKEEISYIPYYYPDLYIEFIGSVFHILTKPMKMSALFTLIDWCDIYVQDQNRKDEKIEELEKLFVKCFDDCYIDDISAYSVFKHLNDHDVYCLCKVPEHPIRRPFFRGLIKWLVPNKTSQDSFEAYFFNEIVGQDQEDCNAIKMESLQILTRKIIRESIWTKVQAEGSQLNERKQEEIFYAGLVSLNLPAKMVDFLH